MALVSYSDSEDSDHEPEVRKASKPEQPKQEQPTTEPKASFKSFVDRSNPRKIRVALTESKEPTPTEDAEDGPAPKRVRLGGGAFSGFNAMLPAPKKSQQAGKAGDGPKGQPRKVFSLKTGATPGFDRQADAELLGGSGLHNGSDGSDGHTEHNDNREAETGIIESKSAGRQDSPNPPAEPAIQGNRLMFKPLSVARKPQKKKSAPSIVPQNPTNTPSPAAAESKPPPKVSLFSLGNSQDTSPTVKTSNQEYEPFVYELTKPSLAPAEDEQDPEERHNQAIPEPSTTSFAPAPSLSTIASDLNLSTAERRQLLGRSGKGSGNAVNIINFNTDKEYDANEAFRAAGEQAVHNPVRSIAPGKHSLKQLVNAASNQKDALEESFASGKRNKKEAGSRYGW
jgi:hypothetical protein